MTDISLAALGTSGTGIPMVALYSVISDIALRTLVALEALGSARKTLNALRALWSDTIRSLDTLDANVAL